MNKYWKLKILVFKDNQQVLNIQGDETTNKRRRQNKLHLRLLIGDRVIANQTISTHSLQINMKKITFVDSNLVGPVPSQSPRLALAAQSYIFKVLSLYIQSLNLWFFYDKHFGLGKNFHCMYHSGGGGVDDDGGDAPYRDHQCMDGKIRRRQWKPQKLIFLTCLKILKATLWLNIFDSNKSFKTLQSSLDCSK